MAHFIAFLVTWVALGVVVGWCTHSITIEGGDK